MARIHAGSQTVAQGIHPTGNPFIVLGAVYPCRNVTARLDLRRQRLETAARIGQVMQHTDGKRVIKRASKRQTVDVRLNDMRVRQIASSREGSFYRHAQVNSDHFTRSPLRGQSGMKSLTTAAFEHKSAFK